MSDNLPVPSPAASSGAEVQLSALAKAAALLALDEQARRGSSGLTADDVEKIAEEAVRKAFLSVGVDLTKLESVEDFRETLAHAKRARGWWEKAGTTVWGAVVLAVASFVIAAVSRHASFGGLK